MPRQRPLPLGGQEDLEELWEHFPRESRRQLVKLYARLIARVTGSDGTRITQEETEHEQFADGLGRQDPH